jgi:hypothetical protein
MISIESGYTLGFENVPLDVNVWKVRPATVVIVPPVPTRGIRDGTIGRGMVELDANAT